LKIAIHQPNYIPYPAFFVKASLSDIFVIYDTAQFTRGDFFNRNRIRTFSFNKCIWLTLPVGKKDFKGVAIDHVRIVDERVFQRHSRTLKVTYNRAPFFDEKICEWIETSHENLAEHNVFMIKSLLGELGINRPRIVLSSELGVAIGHETQGIIDIVKALDGDEYISGIGAKAYLDESLLTRELITLSFLDYKPLKYPQIHPGFVENMSVVDIIFNIGWKDTASKLKQVKTLKKQETGISNSARLRAL
jgi:hypothetical protein